MEADSLQKERCSVAEGPEIEVKWGAVQARLCVH